ncbi:MAG: hypothetical protein ABGY75_21190 [Gemmataceae bacterium]
MLEDIDRHALFDELHRSVERSASAAVEQLLAGAPNLAYPPNYGLTPDEQAALASIQKSPAMGSALRKLIASAAATPIFDLLCLVDGVADAEMPQDVRESDATAVELMLHDGFYESYWAWRRRRPDPGWRLDTYDG